jgi:rhomboid protease GluP
VSDRTEPTAGLRRAIWTGPQPLVGSPVTRAILWINAIVFVAELVCLKAPLGGLIEMPDRASLLFGANVAPLTLGAHQWDRLVMSVFLHGSLLHLAVNMVALHQVGPLVEPHAGSARFAVLCLASGVGASVASVFWADWRGLSYVSFGASGLLCGVMAAGIVTAWRVDGWRGTLPWPIALWLIVVIGVGLSRVGRVDNAAHLGGFVTGCVVAAAWRRGVPDTRAKRITLIGLSAAVCVAAAAATAWRDVRDPYVLLGAEDRANEVGRALKRGDCEAARRALAASEALPPSDAELRGLRTAFDQVCKDTAPRW